MPSIAIAQSYEAIYIVDPGLGEEEVSAITNKYKQLVESNGGTVDKIDVWERRKLAYPIKKRTEGIYVVMLFTSIPSVEAELRRIFLISEDQIRFMIVKPEAAAPGDEAETLPAAAPAAVTPSAPVAAPQATVEPEAVAAPEAPAETESAPTPDVVAETEGGAATENATEAETETPETP